MLTEFAPAKVNLYLHVTGRRPDGYHLLDSLAVFPAIGDRIFAAPATALSLAVTGPFGETLRTEADNLVLRAARRLKPDGKAALRLEKNLPVASGIGGGSADAAAALRVLARLWGLDSPLKEHAAALGADVPVCLNSVPMRMGGIGELLSPAPRLPRCGMVLVNPGVTVSTPTVFQARRGAFSRPAALPAVWKNTTAMSMALGQLRNDLEAAAIGIQPVIGEVLAVLAKLPGVLLARMSGSGATCFALLETPEAAAEAALSLPYPDWWRWGGGLYEPHPGDL